MNDLYMILWMILQLKGKTLKKTSELETVRLDASKYLPTIKTIRPTDSTTSTTSGQTSTKSGQTSTTSGQTSTTGGKTSITSG